MAFAHVGNLGTALSSGNNQASLVLTTTAAAAAGSLVIVLVADDNAQTTDGASTAVSGVVDSAGNTYARAIGWAHGGLGTAQNGADVSIWWCQLTNALGSGGTITATFANATFSDATAMSAKNFSVGAGMVPAVEATAGLINTAAAAGSLNATTANIACLRVRAIASESNSTTALTPTSTWAIFAQAVSGAGTSITEMGLRGEWLISTGTGAASAPTGGAGAVDHASAYVAFKEVAGPQTLTQTARHTETSTFYDPTVTPGAVTLTTELHVDTDDFYAPEVVLGPPPSGGPAKKIKTRAGLYVLDRAGSNIYTRGEITAGAQELTPSLYVDPDTFHAPTVAPGAVILTATLYVEPDVFHAPTVVQGGAPQTLTAPIYNNAGAFHAPTIGRGPVTLTQTAVYVDPAAYYTHVVSIGGGPQIVGPSLHVDGETFFAPTITRGPVVLSPSLYTDGETFFAPTVGRGAVTLTAPIYNNAGAFYAPTVTRGAVTLTPALFVDGDTFHSPLVVLGAGPQVLAPTLYVDPDAFFAPVVARGPVTLTPSTYVDPDAFPAPSVTARATLVPALYTDPDTFYPPTVTVTGAWVLRGNLRGPPGAAAAGVVGTFTLVTGSATSTVVSNAAMTATKVPVFVPLSEEAAMAMINLDHPMYVSARGAGSFTVAHVANGSPNLTFAYAILG